MIVQRNPSKGKFFEKKVKDFVNGLYEDEDGDIYMIVPTENGSVGTSKGKQAVLLYNFSVWTLDESLTLRMLDSNDNVTLHN